jgi:hypothetical protein
VFIPAWNEEASIAAVIDDCRAELPDADVLVIDDGSTDATEQVARDHGADVVRFPYNRGLRAGIAEGYRQALERGYDHCGRLDADGQHLASELKRMLELVASDECDVAVGSRFLPESGAGGERYKPAPERLVGTSLLRLLMRLRLGQPISDGTSGLYAVDKKALELLADDYLCEAPEVEALMRITDAKLRLVEVPVHMRAREHGESSFHGKRAVELVVTIGLTLFAATRARGRARGRARRRGRAAGPHRARDPPRRPPRGRAVRLRRPAPLLRRSARAVAADRRAEGAPTHSCATAAAQRGSFARHHPRPLAGLARPHIGPHRTRRRR